MKRKHSTKGHLVSRGPHIFHSDRHYADWGKWVTKAIAAELMVVGVYGGVREGLLT